MILFDVMTDSDKRGLGDILISTPVVKALKEKYQCRLDYLVRKEAHVLLENNPYIDNVISKANIQDYELRFVLGMRLEDYSIKRNRQPRVDSMAELFGVNLASKVPEIYFPRKTVINRIGISIDSTNPVRSWRDDYLIGLCEKLRKFDLHCVGLNSIELPSFVTNHTSTQTLREFIELVSTFQFVVTTDSFLSHLAAAFDIPSVVLYTEIPKEWRCGYYSQTIGIQSPVNCSPCWARQAPKLSQEIKECYEKQDIKLKCVDALTSEIIYSKVIEMISKQEIVFYHGKHFEKDCNCSFCLLKKELAKGLTDTGYLVREKRLDVDWARVYPSEVHFNMALEYRGKIYGEFFFEADKMPQKIVDFANEYFAYIICSSRYIYSAWLNSGINEDRLIYNPSWIHSESFETTPKCSDKTRFLMVGNWQHKDEWQDRKGLQRGYDLFREVYGDRDDVHLVIKTDKHAPDFSDKNVTVIKDSLSKKKMINLYKSCDYFLSPHKGEGFGRTVLEALWYGCSVGATGYGGVMEFLDENNSTLFGYDLEDCIIYPKEYYSDNQYPKIANPSNQDIISFLRDMPKKRGTGLSKFSLRNRVEALMEKINEWDNFFSYRL